MDQRVARVIRAVIGQRHANSDERNPQLNGIRKFSRDGHTLYHGDCIDVFSSEIADGSVDLIFADPPYNIGKRFANFTDKWTTDAVYADWCKTWLDSCIAKLSPIGSMYVMTSTQCMPYLDLYLRDRISIVSRIVWHYDSSGVQAKQKYGSLYEPILFCAKDPNNYTFNTEDILVEARTGAKRKLIDYRKPVPAAYSTTKVPGNVWFIPRVRFRMPEYEDHPSQKPEALLERIILASSNPNDLILDPFAGAFTTCAVADRLKRRSIGIERELDYVKIGLRRLEVCDELDGERLRPPDKVYKRRNANGARIPEPADQPRLF